MFSGASKFSIVTVCIVATVLTVGAQSHKGSLRGLVTDAYGAVIPGAEVRLEQASPNVVSPIIHKTNTDNEGRYAFSDLAAGRYKLHVKVSWFNRETSKIVELTENQLAPLNVAVSLEPCSDEMDSSVREKLSEADRAEIARILIDGLIDSHRTELSVGEKIILIPENLSRNWMTAEQMNRVSILTRDTIQEITEKSGELTYYSLTSPAQYGSCVSISVIIHVTVKGQIEDANMAGGSDNYEFRKVNGKWASLLVSSAVS